MTSEAPPIRVLVVDDSAVMRRLIKDLLKAEPDIDVCGIARSGQEALLKAKELSPDVITLDVDMPIMDGLTALEHIMDENPTAVIMISSLTSDAARITIRALELGAVDYVNKPSGQISLDLTRQKNEVVRKVRLAAQARWKEPLTPLARPPVSKAPPDPLEQTAPGQRWPPSIVAIGASTGGPRTLMEIIPRLPADLQAAVIIVQHLPDAFVPSFVTRLGDRCALPVQMAEHDTQISPHNVYVAPGSAHLLVESMGRGLYRTVLDNNPRGQSHVPSVGVTFGSLDENYRGRIVACLLTGMGRDGADELLGLRNGGAYTIAEDQSTCIVYGMPRAAIEQDAASYVLPCGDIARQVIDLVQQQ